MNSAHDQAVVLQAASVCLQYPDDTVLARLPLVRRAVDELPGGAARERLTAFLDSAAATAPSRMAQHYVEVFDMRRRCCLYLTWWTDGETRRRGSALAALKARYRTAGVELDTPELPDFLPAVLEFAATADLAAGLQLLQEHRAGHRVAAPGPARCRHPLRGARRGGLRTVAGTVARRRRRGESLGPQRTAAGTGRARAGTVLAGTGGRNPMNALDVLLWGVLPYVMVAVLVGGTIWRYRYDKFGWTTRSSELYESRLLRIGSPLFHFGLLVVIVGHVIGLIIPKSWTDAVGLSQEAYHVQALLLGAVAGFSTLIGVGILVYRRRTTGPVFMATTRNDKLMYAVLVAAIVVGLATTLLGAAGGEEHNYRLTVSPWFRSLFVLQPDVAAMSQSGLAFQLHTLIGMGLFAIWPFTRLVHAFTAPVHYLFRPYIVYRTRQGGAGCAAGPPRLGTQQVSAVQKSSLDALARELLAAACASSAGRAARTVYGGHEHVLRQTVIALAAGQVLAEHDNPGEATVHVLHGRVRLVCGADSWEGRKGDLLVVPDASHSLEAAENSAVLLTVAKTGR